MTRFPNILKKKKIIKVGQIRDPGNCKTKRGHVQQLLTVHKCKATRVKDRHEIARA